MSKSEKSDIESVSKTAEKETAKTITKENAKALRGNKTAQGSVLAYSQENVRQMMDGVSSMKELSGHLGELVDHIDSLETRQVLSEEKHMIYEKKITSISIASLIVMILTLMASVAVPIIANLLLSAR